MAIKLKYGLNEEGKMIHISEAERGIKCQCSCAKCGVKLVARKGEKTPHHFAHNKTKECEGAIDTAIYLTAKQIVHSNERIKLPNGEWFIYTSSSIDYPYDNIIADVLIEDVEKSILIDISVNARSDAQKKKFCKHKDITAIEIDLTEVDREIEYNALRDLIMNKKESKQFLHQATKPKEGINIEMLPKVLGGMLVGGLFYLLFKRIR